MVNQETFHLHKVKKQMFHIIGRLRSITIDTGFHFCPTVLTRFIVKSLSGVELFHQRFSSLKKKKIRAKISLLTKPEGQRNIQTLQQVFIQLHLVFVLLDEAEKTWD